MSRSSAVRWIGHGMNGRCTSPTRTATLLNSPRSCDDSGLSWLPSQIKDESQGLAATLNFATAVGPSYFTQGTLSAVMRVRLVGDSPGVPVVVADTVVTGVAAIVVGDVDVPSGR